MQEPAAPTTAGLRSVCTLLFSFTIRQPFYMTARTAPAIILSTESAKPMMEHTIAPVAFPPGVLARDLTAMTSPMTHTISPPSAKTSERISPMMLTTSAAVAVFFVSISFIPSVLFALNLPVLF